MEFVVDTKVSSLILGILLRLLEPLHLSVSGYCDAESAL